MGLLDSFFITQTDNSELLTEWTSTRGTIRPSQEGKDFQSEVLWATDFSGEGVGTPVSEHGRELVQIDPRGEAAPTASMGVLKAGGTPAQALQILGVGAAGTRWQLHMP